MEKRQHMEKRAAGQHMQEQIDQAVAGSQRQGQLRISKNEMFCKGL